MKTIGQIFTSGKTAFNNAPKPIKTSGWGIVNKATNNPADNIRYDSGDSLWGWLSGKDAEYRNYMYNKLAADTQWQRELKMWKMNNEYNSTKNQLKRWLEAGGTAAAFFAQNQAGSSQAPNAPTQAATASYANGPEGIQALTNATNTAMQSYWQMRKTKAEAEGKDLENGKYIELTDAMIAEKLGHVKLMEQQGNLTHWQATQIKELLPFLKGKSEAEIDQIKESTNLLREQQKTQRKQRWLMGKQGKKLDQDTLVGQYTANKLQWENEFRNKWGIDPSQHGWASLIQVLAQGKGGEIFDGLFQSLEGVGEDITNIPLQATPNGFAFTFKRKALKFGAKLAKQGALNYDQWIQNQNKKRGKQKHFSW